MTAAIGTRRQKIHLIAEKRLLAAFEFSLAVSERIDDEGIFPPLEKSKIIAPL
jgi:hypothetical protein